MITTMDCKTKPKKFVIRVAQEPLNIAGKMLGCIQNVLKGTMLNKKIFTSDIVALWTLWISQITKQSIRLINCGSVSFRKTKIHLLECNF